MIVNPASKMFSAISLGVFCRSAPSTSAIMRSRKVSPGLEVILTLIWSERTRVPPVTAERSPPASRITGADSPVMADSSTDATPSMISPSEGMNSPAETCTRSPVLSFELGILSIRPSLPSNRFATVSDRALRSVSAWALPRPSAMASAKFAKSTVNQSQSVICRLKINAAPPLNSSTVVITLPISTTNMTGLPIILRGFNLTNESTIARRTIFHSQTAFLRRLSGDWPSLTDGICGGVFISVVVAIATPLESFARGHQQVFKNRPEAQCREKCQRTHNDDHANQKHCEKGRGHRERSQ